MLFTCIKSWFFRNHLANFHQISHWSFCWNVIDSLFKWSCSIDCQAHIFFFKTKNCSNDDIFISCDDRIWKMLHNICMSAVAMSLRWANLGPWASCFPYISILKTLKIFLSETTWLIQYNMAAMFLRWPSTKIVQAIMIPQKTWLVGQDLFSLYIYTENFKNLLVINNLMDFNII